jgi:phosphohistidine phosphatase
VTRRIVLIRHADTAPGAPDIARRLTDRGQRDARQIGRWLEQHDVVPDHVMVSPAVRAAETWTIAAAELPGTVETTTDDRIYANTVADVVAVIASAPAAAGTVAVVGHNPALGELAMTWGAAAAGFPTAALAVFATEQAWELVDATGTTLTALATCRG